MENDFLNQHGRINYLGKYRTTSSRVGQFRELILKSKSIFLYNVN